jgi:hypothetical protein
LILIWEKEMYVYIYLSMTSQFDNYQTTAHDNQVVI